MLVIYVYKNYAMSTKTYDYIEYLADDNVIYVVICTFWRILAG